MFDHERFEVLAFEDIPPRRDLQIMDEVWMPAIEQEYLRFFARVPNAEPSRVGYICPVALTSVDAIAAHLAWYPTFERFHEVPIILPRDAFVTCVVAHNCDDTPRVFVRSQWLADLYERRCAAFAMVDAIGVKRGLHAGTLPPARLLALREAVDALAAAHPQLGFLSFADSILIKQVWTIGQFNTPTPYNYAPEALLVVVEAVRRAFADVLGLDAYAVLTQGLNAYDDPHALHTSDSGNHVSLNTLATPFAELMAIDTAVKTALKARTQAPAELYMDRTFFRSLRWRHAFDKNSVPAHVYASPTSRQEDGGYVAMSMGTVMEQLQ